MRTAAILFIAAVFSPIASAVVVVQETESKSKVANTCKIDSVKLRLEKTKHLIDEVGELSRADIQKLEQWVKAAAQEPLVSLNIENEASANDGRDIIIKLSESDKKSDTIVLRRSKKKLARGFIRVGPNSSKILDLIKKYCD